MKSHSPGAAQGAAIPTLRNRRRTSSEAAQLLADLTRVPYVELPPSAARVALAEAIRCGEIDGLYRPLGTPHHNVTLSGLPPDVDPRVTIARWTDWWNAGKNASDELLAAHAATATHARARGLSREAPAARMAREAAILRQQRGRAHLTVHDALDSVDSTTAERGQAHDEHDEQIEGGATDA